MRTIKNSITATTICLPASDAARKQATATWLAIPGTTDSKNLPAGGYGVSGGGRNALTAVTGSNVMKASTTYHSDQTTQPASAGFLLTIGEDW